MSPSEADLRAALRDGEGDGVDPYDIISNVRHARARRRSMLLSAAAAVVVAGTVAGVTALVHGTGPGSPSSATANGAATHGSMSGGGSTAASSRPAAEKPSRPGLGREPGMQIAPVCGPAGASPADRAHSFGSLLAGPVDEFVVCAHSIAAAPPTSVAHQVRITGQAAGLLAESIRNLTATSMPPGCPQVMSTGNPALDIVPITRAGKYLPTLTARIGLPVCSTTVTNGRITRYDWHIPPRVAALLPRTPGTFKLIPPVRGESGAPPR